MGLGRFGDALEGTTGRCDPRAVHLPRRYAALALSLFLTAACSEETISPVPDPRVEVLGRCADQNPVRNHYFGDLHVHTALSLDANLQGNRLSVSDAYRFARGDEPGWWVRSRIGTYVRPMTVDDPLLTQLRVENGW